MAEVIEDPTGNETIRGKLVELPEGRQAVAGISPRTIRGIMTNMIELTMGYTDVLEWGPCTPVLVLWQGVVVGSLTPPTLPGTTEITETAERDGGSMCKPPRTQYVRMPVLNTRPGRQFATPPSPGRFLFPTTNESLYASVTASRFLSANPGTHGPQRAWENIHSLIQPFARGRQTMKEDPTQGGQMAVAKAYIQKPHARTDF
ncbi:hypothetical protein HOY80DRAFT_1083351 [Tuber brumale]|nr:hypothetical protein HOY80DRAFT_1083351 [Tuber brumale]